MINDQPMNDVQLIFILTMLNRVTVWLDTSMGHDLFRFALLAGDALEVPHVGGQDRGSCTNNKCYSNHHKSDISQ